MDVLKYNTLACPNCKQLLHFKQAFGMRLVSDGYYDAICPTDNLHFKIESKKNQQKKQETCKKD